MVVCMHTSSDLRVYIRLNRTQHSVLDRVVLAVEPHTQSWLFHSVQHMQGTWTVVCFFCFRYGCGMVDVEVFYSFKEFLGTQWISNRVPNIRLLLMGNMKFHGILSTKVCLMSTTCLHDTRTCTATLSGVSMAQYDILHHEMTFNYIMGHRPNRKQPVLAILPWRSILGSYIAWTQYAARTDKTNIALLS